ncbi:ATP-grasp domain-containing protein [Streptomyces griseoviridis]|uniref:Glutathione synthase/RimK-type ligase-like ATP-grasp enzyme n=1 Tax=Streptomyces griseoviridis TaxID=45398 RepID=A0ABT9LCZ9_STRGD|nr:hypothetical protein [Streptomyces griseoviridis]MDP9681601.1 glutathione synthase/RimK-type ligase-like ATP-grasp enzyme [Streptomyces griseoviridis]GGS73370.1 ATP-grasp domain-containing protein [Streptomyces griseoviridis]
MPRIALVTCRPAPDIGADRDLPVLARALADAGADVRVEVWDDGRVGWDAFDLVLIRSTWDYSRRPAEFLAWAERVPRLANPAGVVRWNADKRYLGDLAAAGVPVVPTRYLAPGDTAGLPRDHEYVIKPASGAGARYAARYTPDEHATAVRQLARMHAEGLTAMVQPYVRGVDSAGERALLYFGGELMHASRKGAVLAPGTPYDEKKVAHPGLEPWRTTLEEAAVARRALAAVPGGDQPLYARVDLVTGDDGTSRVMELELIEPNLFLWLHPDSLPRVVGAVLSAATR